MAAITQAQLDTWASEYAGLIVPGMSAYQAWQAWIATGPSREVPQLNAITYQALGHVFNETNLSIHNDTGSQFKDKPSTLNFYNDLVDTGGSAYLNPSQVLIYYDGNTKKVEPFRLP